MGKQDDGPKEATKTAVATDAEPAGRRICQLEGCRVPVLGNPKKRFCCDQHRWEAWNRRHPRTLPYRSTPRRRKAPDKV